MGKRMVVCLLAIFLILSLAFSVSAGSYEVGEVLYHQDFGSLSLMHTEVTGIRKGTNSSPDSMLWLNNSALYMITNDDLRTYALLPEIPWTESYTIEFDFWLCDPLSTRGYLAFMLTCWGEEPSNITSLVIRADGTIDDFGTLSPEMTEILQKQQEMIHVEIPIENGILYEVTLSAGDTECTLQRESLRRIAEGGRGFCIRNTSAAIGEIYIVNGTGYTAKNGELAGSSWSDDPAHAVIDPAPPTGEPMGLVGITILTGAAAIWAKRTKRHH